MKLVVLALLAIVSTGCTTPSESPKIVTSIPKFDACNEFGKAMTALEDKGFEGARVHFEEALVFAEKYEADATDSYQESAARFVAALRYFVNVPLGGYTPGESSPEELRANGKILYAVCTK